MHGLVLLDAHGKPLRRAILWNDTRTTQECKEIEDQVGLNKILSIAKNRPLEGFTLPKLLWVKKHEREVYDRAETFLLPKDYVRYRLTGDVAMDYSDAAGTLLLNVPGKKWSEKLCRALEIDPGICPRLVASEENVGALLSEVAESTGLSPQTRVFAGGADNACGAVGSGILSDGQLMCSIGTSGVMLGYEKTGSLDFGGKVHYFNHARPDAFYIMGVTLSAGDSLNWFKETFIKEVSFSDIAKQVNRVQVGAGGLLFTPFLAGERTPHADANIRGSFIGIDPSHTKWHFARAVMEGITFSQNESVELLKQSGKVMDQVVSVGGGAKSTEWLQIQADIFDLPVVKLKNEQGPGMGAAMIAAYGCGWFDSLEQCAEVFVQREGIIEPIKENVSQYKELFGTYQKIYEQTKGISRALKKFRK
jgi:xylulokinase